MACVRVPAADRGDDPPARPTGRRGEFRRLGSTVARALDGIWSLKQARTLAAADAELGETFDELLVGGPQSPEMIWSRPWSPSKATDHRRRGGAAGRLLLIAGFETTVNAIGSGVRRLLEDREQWELLVGEPDRAPAVAEEVLRFDPPVQETARVAHIDIEVGGVSLQKNQWVITLLAAANRDPEVFPEPNVFDVTRESPAEHLAFSGGIHYCLGSPLARMELAMALRALAERFPDLEQPDPSRCGPVPPCAGRSASQSRSTSCRRSARSRSCWRRARSAANDVPLISAFAADQRRPSGETGVNRRIRSARTHTLISIRAVAGLIEVSLTRTEQDRHVGQMHLVYQSGPEVLPDCRRAAGDQDVLITSCLESAVECALDSVGDEVERRAPFLYHGLPRVVGQHEDVVVVRRVVTPPTGPILVGPFAANRSEHVAAHDRRADPGPESGSELVIDPLTPTVFATHLVEHASGDEPVVQSLAADAERIIEALIRSGGVAVDGDADAVHAHDHGYVPSVPVR